MYLVTDKETGEICTKMSAAKNLMFTTPVFSRFKRRYPPNIFVMLVLLLALTKGVEVLTAGKRQSVSGRGGWQNQVQSWQW